MLTIGSNSVASMITVTVTSTINRNRTGTGNSTTYSLLGTRY